MPAQEANNDEDVEDEISMSTHDDTQLIEAEGAPVAGAPFVTSLRDVKIDLYGVSMPFNCCRNDTSRSIQTAGGFQ